MPRPEKVAAVAEIRERIEASEAVFVTEFRGLSVKQLGALRRKLRENGAEYKVVKMTLARRATGDLGLEAINEHLTGPSGLTFSHGDPVATAKVLRDLNKENERLVIKAAILSGKVISPEQVTALAEVEPREVLLAKIAGAAKAPLYKTAGLMASFTRNAATMFSQLLEKKEATGDDTAASAPTPAPAEEAVAEDSVAGDAPAEETPAVEAAVDEVPVDEVPVDEVPVDEAPAGDTPADETVVEDSTDQTASGEATDDDAAATAEEE